MLQEKYRREEAINESMYYATEVQTKRKVVIKTVSFKHMDEKQKEKLILEINTLTSHKSNHIIKYYNYSVDKKAESLQIAMEYYEKGSSLDMLIKHQK